MDRESAGEASRGPRVRRAAVWVAIPLAIGAVTWAGRAADAATISSFYMLAVLALAAWGGQIAGAVASVLAMFCFNFFFLPPLGTIAVADPVHWVALVAFLAASTLASRLVATARARADEARRRQREIESLYELSVGLFAVSQRPGALGDSTARVLQGIDATSGALFIPGPGGEPVQASSIGEDGIVDATLLKEIWRSGDSAQSLTERGERTTYLPLHIGGHFAGLLVTSGPAVPHTVLDPAARMLALAIERERLLAESAHLQAVRESDALKTSLLRAVSHDLRTPLTAMRLEIESLQDRLAGSAAAPSLRNLAVEQARLARRIDNLLALARLEAGLARPRPEPTPPGSLLRASRESLALALAGREVTTRIAPGCPDLQADPSLTLEIMVNLLENAARATPVNLPLELAASPAPGQPDRVRLEVLDRGPGVPDAARHLPGATGDSASGGLGLRIAESFATAQGGSLELLDRPGGGTIARVTLPATPEPAEPSEETP